MNLELSKNELKIIKQVMYNTMLKTKKTSTDYFAYKYIYDKINNIIEVMEELENEK